MTSFISALSLVVLALVSGCFTLPITENPLSDTSSPFYNDVTTDKPLGERMVSDDATMFSTSSMFEDATRESRMFEDATQEPHMFEGATRESRMVEDATRESRMFEDATQEPHMFEDATRESRMFEDATGEPRMVEDATRESRMLTDEATVVSATFVPTTERMFHQQREMKNPSTVTVEPTTERAELIPRDFGMDFQNETEVATESSHSKREFDDSDFTTSNSVSGMRSSEQLFATVEPETSSTEMQMDFTTIPMFSFTSTSSAAAPQLYTREPSKARKYTGLLADKADQEEEKEHNDEKHESGSEEHKRDDEVKKDKKHKKVHRKHDKDEFEKEEPKKEGQKESSEEKKVSRKDGKEQSEKEEPKPEGDKEIEEGRQPEKHDEDNFEKDVEAAEPKDVIKKRPTTFRKPKVESDDGIQYPKAVYDQDAWNKIPQIPSDFAVLDETSDVVTAFSKLDSLHTVESHTEESKLNQGKESSRAE